MIRFAISVTAIEIALTLGAAAWVTFSENGEPYVTKAELETLGISVEKYSTERKMRFGELFSFDTQAVLPGSSLGLASGDTRPGPALLVSVRVNTPKVEYDSRLAGERHPRMRDGDELPVVNEEPWPDELGYVVRQRVRNGVRAEVVRLRGKNLLIVRMNWTNIPLPPDRAGEAVAKCEHFARLLQDFMVTRKLGWRE
jgi:hypothetical protein